MTLEQKLEKIWGGAIAAWKWDGRRWDFPTSEHYHTKSSKMNREIETADEALALLSPLEYVREYRKWYERNKK